MTAAILDFAAIRKRMNELDSPQAEPSLGAWRVELHDLKSFATGGRITIPVYAGGVGDGPELFIPSTRCKTINLKG